MTPDPRPEAEAIPGEIVRHRGATALGVRTGPFSGWSLRRTLVASILAMFVVLTLATSLFTALILQRSLESDLDQRVTNTAMRAFRLADPASRPPPDPDGGPRGLGGDYLTLIVANQTVVRNDVFAADGQHASLSEPQIRALLADDLSRSPTTVDLGGELGRYRLVGVTRGDVRIVAGLPTAQLDASVDRLRILTLATGFAGLLLLGVATAWVVRVSLRPLERVAATAVRVAHLPLSTGEVSLSERVPARDTDPRTEVGQVGASLNELLDHVDDSLRARHESEQRLRRFVADASHELRTPLASIRGYAELSRRERENVPDGVRHALTRIESEADRMGDLVEDLLLLARLDAGRPLAQEAVDLTMLLVDAVGDARVAGGDHAWRLDLPEEPVEVVGDDARLRQVVVNLLANARVHTPPGTTVTARVRGDAGAVVVEVEDDGPGIDPELLPHVFGRFTRGDAARVRSGGSTGLGLSIVRAVASAHHGTVEVESEPGRTLFRLRLPAEPPE